MECEKKKILTHTHTHTHTRNAMPRLFSATPRCLTHPKSPTKEE